MSAAGLPSPEIFRDELRGAITALDGMARLRVRSVDAFGRTVWKYPLALSAWLGKVENDTARIVRKFLQQNYAANRIARSTSPHYRRTGKLAAAIRRAIVRVYIRDRRAGGEASENIVIRVMLPPGIPPYEYTPKTERGQHSRSNFYRVAASLNYGAVRAPRTWREVMDLPTGERSWQYKPIIGEAAKRSIKKYVLTGKISERAKKRIESGAESKMYGGKIIKGYKIGEVSHGLRSARTSLGGAKVVVIRPFGFFNLTPSQIRQLEYYLVCSLLEHYERALKNA